MRIVLVDPSRAIQHAMTDLVVQDGHEVVAFCEGLKALEHLKLDASARALVTSVQLPDVSGLEGRPRPCSREGYIGCDRRAGRSSWGRAPCDAQLTVTLSVFGLSP